MGKLKFRTKMIILFVLVAYMGISAMLISRAGMRSVEAYAKEVMTTRQEASSSSVSQGNALEEDFATMNKMVKSQNNRLSLIILGLLAVVIAIGLLITYDLLHTLNKIEDYAILVAKGDFSQDLDEKYLSRKDTAGTLAVSFEKITRNIKDLINTIKTESLNLKKGVEGTDNSVSCINEEIDTISATTQELASGMEETASSVQQMNAMSQEIDSVAKVLAENSQNGAWRVAEIHKRAKEAKEATLSNRKQVEDMHNEIGEKLNKALKDVEVVSQIEELSQAIMQITSQTNLLALNASIEAARAGEAGKGFTVVANEIRNLAEESNDTVSHIQEITGKVIEAVNNLSGDSRRLLDFVAVDVNKSFDVFDGLSENYSGDAEYVDSMVSDFSASSQELLASIDNIVEAISGVSDAATEGAASTQNIAAKVQNILAGCEEVTEELKNTENSAFNLARYIGTVKL